MGLRGRRVSNGGHWIELSVSDTGIVRGIHPGRCHDRRKPSVPARMGLVSCSRQRLWTARMQYAASPGGQPRSSVSQLRQANPKVGVFRLGAADVRAGAGNVRRLSPFADHRAHDLLDANGFLHQARKLVRQQREPEGSQAAQVQLAKVITSDRAPTKTKLEAQVASKLNQLRDTNFRPR